MLPPKNDTTANEPLADASSAWRRKRKPRRLLAKAAMSLFSLVALFAIAELALRGAGARHRTIGVPHALFSRDPSLGWIGRPSVAYSFSSSEFEALSTHAADGFRQCGLESTLDADGTGHTREYGGARQEIVWCVGDSYTWGWGVADEETWVSLLNEKTPANRRYRNLGVPGFSPLQECLLLEKLFADGRRPDCVLVLYCSNDPHDNFNDNRRGPHYELVDGGAKLHASPVEGGTGISIDGWLKRNSLAYNHFDSYLKGALQKLGLRRGKNADQAENGGLPGPRVATAIERQVLRDTYRRLKTLCDENQVALTVATFERDGVIGPVCEELAIHLIDVSACFDDATAATAGGRATRYARDGHWNALGHKVAADGLYVQLEYDQMAKAAEEAKKR